MEVTESEACVSNTTGKMIFAKLECSMYFIEGLKHLFAPVVHQTVVSFNIGSGTESEKSKNDNKNS